MTMQKGAGSKVKEANSQPRRHATEFAHSLPTATAAAPADAVHFPSHVADHGSAQAKWIPQSHFNDEAMVTVKAELPEATKVAAVAWWQKLLNLPINRFYVLMGLGAGLAIWFTIIIVSSLWNHTKPVASERAGQAVHQWVDSVAKPESQNRATRDANSRRQVVQRGGAQPAFAEGQNRRNQQSRSAAQASPAGQGRTAARPNQSREPSEWLPPKNRPNR